MEKYINESNGHQTYWEWKKYMDKQKINKKYIEFKK